MCNEVFGFIGLGRFFMFGGGGGGVVHKSCLRI